MTGGEARASADTPASIDALRRFRCFSGIDESVLARLCVYMTWQTWPKGSVLLEPGRDPGALVMLTEGRIVLSVKSDKDGHELVVDVRDAPSYLAVPSFLEGRTQVFRAKTLTAVQTASLPTAYARRLLTRCPDFALDVAEELAAGQAAVLSRLGGQVFLSSEERVLAALCKLTAASLSADRAAERPRADWRHVVGVTHSLLGSMSSTTRESACRVMSDLAAGGLVVALPGPPQSREYFIDLGGLQALRVESIWG